MKVKQNKEYIKQRGKKIPNLNKKFILTTMGSILLEVIIKGFMINFNLTKEESASMFLSNEFVYKPFYTKLKDIKGE